MLNDREFLEKRLELFTMEAWSLFTEELNDMAKSLENIQTIADEKHYTSEEARWIC